MRVDEKNVKGEHGKDGSWFGSLHLWFDGHLHCMNCFDTGYRLTVGDYFVCILKLGAHVLFAMTTMSIYFSCK